MATVASSATVFIVDDDRGLLRLIGKALRREGFSSAAAASAGEAIDWLARNHADLMLLDLKLPDIEGKELIRHLAEIQRSIPFVVITGQGDERVAVEMMKFGAVDYLVKDADFLQFVPEVVRRAIKQIGQERKLAAAEEALRRNEANRKRLENEILHISEREQHRIGQDLHDGLCQHLAGIEFMSQVLAQRLASKSKAEAAGAAEIAKLVRTAISQTRDLARGLSPVVLESNGLMSALKELAENTEQRFQISCQFQCDEPVLFHDNAVATHLYRIAQEAVSNAIKHGQAKHVTIQLVIARPRIVLLIKDDGAGLPRIAAKHQGMGLRIMQYRAGTVGGSLAVQRDPNGGTRVTCSFQSRNAQPSDP